MSTNDLAERLDALPASKRALVEQRLAMLRSRPRTCEISLTQQGLWFLDQLTPNSPLYTLAWRVELSGRFDPDAFEAAVTALVARHGALRTRFSVVDGRPVQIVLPQVPTPLRIRDLTGPPSAELDVMIDAACAAEVAEGFDLTTAPLLRVRVLRAGETRTVVMVLVHHIVFDALSMDVLVGELAQLYRAHLSGEPVPAQPAVHYHDFATWQREYLSGERLDRLLDYWRDRLAGCGEVLTVPTDRPRPTMQSFRGAEFRHRLPSPLSEGLHELARSERATLFMVLLAAFEVLLSRYSGQPEVAVGSTVGGRTRTEFQSTIGFFVNTLVLTADLGDDPSFRTFLRQVRSTCLAAYHHQDLPFDRLVEELAPQRSLSYNPLFQATFDVHHDSGQRPEFPGLVVESMEFIDAGMSKFDLSFTAVESGGEIELTVEYATDLFDQDTISRMVDNFQVLLTGVVADPDRTVGELPMLAEAERLLVTRRWNDTAGPVPDVTLVDLVDAQVARTPDAVAVTYQGFNLSYAELDSRADRVAAMLIDRGVGPESLVGVLLDRSAELAVGLLGVLKAGGAFVPLDPGYPGQRLAYVIADAKLSMVLTTSGLRDRLPAEAPVFCLDSQADELPGYPDVSPRSGPHPGNAAYVIYTSGSTGKPKGAINSHRNIVNQLVWAQRLYRLDESDAILQKTPLGFDDSVRECFWALSTGARLVMAIPDGHRDPAYLADVVQAESVTVLHVVPSLLQAIVDDRTARTRFGNIRLLLSGGEVLGPSLQQRVFECFDAEFVNTYGPSEAAVDLTHWVCRPDETVASVPIGAPGLNTTVYVLDGRGAPVPIGVPGELYLGGRQIGRGYLGRSGLTAQRFVPDPFGAEPGARLYRTGDVCRLRADGQLEYLGRTDHQIKIRGMRIELEEIDAALATHPRVRDAAVLAREVTPGDQRLVGYVVPVSMADQPAVGGLRAHLGTTLPSHMVPADYVMLDALPLNSNGKVDRAALRRLEPTRSVPEESYEAPRTDTEAVIAAIWAEVLRLDRVGANDNFFGLGGHSLLAARAVALTRETFEQDLPVSALFQAATPATFAQDLAARFGDPEVLAERAASIRSVLELADEEVAEQLEALPGR